MELLQQVRIIEPNEGEGIDRLADVLIIEGKIFAIADSLTDYPQDTEILTADNLILGTGLVDLYSHSGEPGNEARETLLTLAEAAAAGGFTQVAILPDTIPQINNADVLASIRQKSNYLNNKNLNNKNLNSQNLQLPQLHFWGAASHGKATKQMNELTELKLGVVGFSDEYNLGNLNLFKQVLEYVKPWQMPIAIALSKNELTGNGVVREGIVSLRYGMVGNPAVAEASIIAAVLEIVAAINTPVHIMGVSTERGVDLIANAKQRGVPVTASTTWMHLLFDSEENGSYDPNLRLEPPLGDKNDIKALITATKAGIIDAIAINHQAYTYEEKTVPFALAPPGVIGLEFALPLLWQRFVSSGEWTALELWQALSSRPRQCLQQQPVTIAAGQTADLVLFDPQQVWLADQYNLKTTATNTPWWNQKITGRAVKIWRS